MPKTRRRLLFLSVAAVVVGLAAGVWLLWPSRTAITRQNAAKIEMGMSLAEVETILGGPARDESTGPCATDFGDGTQDELLALQQRRFIDLMRVARANDRFHVWHSDVVEVYVECDAQGRVQGYDAFPVWRVQESPLDMLRRWLGL